MSAGQVSKKRKFVADGADGCCLSWETAMAFTSSPAAVQEYHDSEDGRVSGTAIVPTVAYMFSGLRLSTIWPLYCQVLS